MATPWVAFIFFRFELQALLTKSSVPRGGASSRRAHLDTTTGTQPSGCRGVSIAPCCSVNAAFLFAEPRMLVVASRCAPRNAQATLRLVFFCCSGLIPACCRVWPCCCSLLSSSPAVEGPQRLHGRPRFR